MRGLASTDNDGEDTAAGSFLLSQLKFLPGGMPTAQKGLSIPPSWDSRSNDMPGISIQAVCPGQQLAGWQLKPTATKSLDHSPHQPHKPQKQDEKASRRSTATC